MNEENNVENIVVENNNQMNINNEVPNNINKEKKSIIDNKTFKLIITIVIGLLVIYATGYTVYYVFIVPDEEKEAQIKEENSTSMLMEEATKYLEYVPYYFDEDSAYDYNKAIYDNISSPALMKTLLNIAILNEDVLYTGEFDFNAFKTENCTQTDKTCFVAEYETINNLLKNHYGINLIISQKDYIISEEEKCEYNDGLFYCVVENSDAYSGKISVIESVRESTTNLYIYERALFVQDLMLDTSSPTNNTYYIGKVMVLPTSNTYFEENISIVAPDGDYANTVVEKYASKAKLYKHTFNINEDSYTWISTEIVQDITQ